MKKISYQFAASLLAVLSLLSLLAACGGTSYKSDVPVSQLAEAINEKLSGLENLDPVDENYITVQQRLPLGDCEEYIEMLQTGGVGIDEYGLFRMKNADAAEAMRAAAESYLTTARASFNENYAPHERPKIDSAEVRVFGNYVVYAVLSDTEKSAVFSTLESMLKQ